jgi:hypothetical protein
MGLFRQSPRGAYFLHAVLAFELQSDGVPIAGGPHARLNDGGNQPSVRPELLSSHWERITYGSN